MLRYEWKGWKWAGTVWLIFITVLFFLPASAFPQENWLNKIYFDKWVHFGFLFVLIFLWRFSLPFFFSYRDILLLLLLLLYAFIVEIIQYKWVPNRSFDLWDVVAGMAGAVAGLVFWLKWLKKNKPL